MNRLSNDVLVLLLNWIRTKRDLAESQKNKKALKENLKQLETTLQSINITDLSILHQSQDYYTLSYANNGISAMKQFTSEEVENL